MSEFWKRTLSGVVYVAVVVGCILYNEYLFAALSAILASLAVREFNRLIRPHELMDIFSEFGAFMLVALIASWLHGWPLFSALGVFYIIWMLAAIIIELWNKNGNPVVNWGNLIAGQVMITLPFALMNVLNHIDSYLLLAVFVLIWVNDSGAYCVGVLTAKKMPGGNHKMFPRVSPKKSWEGLFGGLAFSIGAAFILNRFGWFDTITKPGFELLIACAFAFVVSAFGTLGDLMESLFKRTIGVKDSGKFLPGHGGVLDRFDSILLAAPVTLLFVLMMISIH